MGNRQPTSPMKFALGLTFIGLAYVLLVPGAALTAQGRISPLWLVGLYFLEVVGEMCISPVGLSTVTKLAPARLVGIMMGVWFLAAALGNKLAGFLSGFFVANEPGTLVRLYGGIAVGLLLSAAVLFLLRKKVEALMGGRPLRGGPPSRFGRFSLSSGRVRASRSSARDCGCPRSSSTRPPPRGAPRPRRRPRAAPRQRRAAAA